jgi:rhodanese-related sulfurtransferase
VGYEKVIGYLQGGIEAWIGDKETIRTVTAEDIKEANDRVVLDVRKPGEWAVARIKDARFVPLSEMPENLEDMDKDLDYVVHCAGGYRSMIACSLMKQRGFKNPSNVDGGFAAMQQAGHPTITDEILV